MQYLEPSKKAKIAGIGNIDRKYKAVTLAITDTTKISILPQRGKQTISHLQRKDGIINPLFYRPDTSGPM